MPSEPASGDSWKVQFRLNRALSEADRLVLEKMLELKKQGFSDHDICIPALMYYYLENAGVPESVEVRNMREVALQLAEIRRLSIEKIQLLLEILAGRGVVLTDDEREEFARGLDDDTMSRIFSGVEGEQFEIDEG